MERFDYQYEIKKLKVVLGISSIGTLISALVFLQTISNAPSAWKLICALLGFLGLSANTAMVFWRLIAVKRESKLRLEKVKA